MQILTPPPSTERTNLITPPGYKRLIDEYNHLYHVERPQVVEEVSFAARQGDRSENAEYIYGKKRLREIDSRLRYLSSKINTAKIIDPKTQKSDVVLFGATVQLETEDGIKKVYQIVGADEIDVQNNKISCKSPVGMALLKNKAGDYVEVETPKGITIYKIISFEYK